ncbi:hypothetical protein HDU80_010131, partial [Chytriomyces hyalinus]
HHLPEPVARKIFAQIVLAVQHLQVQGIVHRDIKDENIVVDSSYNVKMIDFGSAANIPKAQAQYFTQFCGTIPYASPEIVRKESYRGPEVEVWALGVLLYTMIFGKNPFRNGKERAEGIVVMPRGFHLDSDRDYSGGKAVLTNPQMMHPFNPVFCTSGCRNLIRGMLEFDPKSRSTIDEVLSHPWLKREVEIYQKAYVEQVCHLIDIPIRAFPLLLINDIDHHLPEPVAKKIFAQIALAVQHLQVKGLVHRDIKDENIVVDSSYNVKMIDFGSAANIPKAQPQYFTQFCGTIPYASPEILRKESYRGPEVEVWSLGVLLYTMIFGKNPFCNGKERAEGIVVMPRGFHLDSDRDYSGGCRNLIRGMLEFDPKSRSTIDEVLSHPWLKREVEIYQKAYGSAQSAA